MADEGSGKPAPSEPVPPTASRLPADGLNAWLEGKGQRKRLGHLPGVMLGALRLVNRADRKGFLLVSAIQLASAALLGVQLAVGKEAVDGIVATETGQSVVRSVLPPLLALAAVTALIGLATSVATQLQRVVNEKVLRASWDDVLHVTSSVSLETYESPEFFEELHRVEVAAIQRPLDIARGLVTLVSGVAGTVVLVVVLTRTEPLLPLLLLVSLPPLWLLTRRRGKNEYAFVRDQATTYRERNYLRGQLTAREAAAEIRSFSLAGSLRERYSERYDRYIGGLSGLVRTQLRLSLVEAVIASTALALTLLFLVHLTATDRVSLGEAAVAAVAIRLLAGRVTSLLTGVSRLYESALFLQDLEAFRGRAPQDAGSTLQPGSPPQPEGRAAPPLERLSLRDVTMTYPSGDRPALDHIDLDIGAGEVVALVGENGSGKTTLAKVIAQLYRPQEGRILWNGVPAETYGPEALRRRVAVIFQEYEQWELTAHDNIALGRSTHVSDREAVVDAAERAGAADFIRRLPAGFDTLLSTSYVGGSQLSIGQWQRVAMARALFRDADLVVLDEPSSALDPRAESELFRRLREIVDGRGVLFISHRFSTVRSADRICVMREGRIVEEGDHDTLMALRGEYAELFTLQAAAYVASERSTD